MRLKQTSILDFLGISSATICMVHCLIFPLLTVFPMGLSHNNWIDLVFSCIGTVIVSKIMLSNTDSKIKIILGLSNALVLIGVLLELLFEFHSCLILLGGIGMIVGHFMNYKSHKI